MKTNRFIVISAICALTVLSASCKKTSTMKIEYEKYKLDNGLEVVLHEDHSDPIAAVAIQYHVGSNREYPGKTGYAHLFEHMLFQASEHLERDVFFKKIDELGGTFNGGTWQDGTIYYESVPKDALEKVLWMESDRMGFFINTVSEAGLRREQDVVINEKRERVDNVAYGFTSEVISKNLYPAGHPYSWQVIGEMADLKTAHVDDIKAFYNNFYGTNNATLVIAGDFEPDTVKALVEKYFGEIQPRETVTPLEKQPAVLDSTKKFFHEDAFAQLPELRITYPGADMFSDDALALDVLTSLLSDGKKAPVYRKIVLEKKLGGIASMFTQSSEIAGTVTMVVRGFENTDLNEAYSAYLEGLEEFEKEGVNERALEGIKNSIVTQQYTSMASILDLAEMLAMNNVFYGKPDRMVDEIEKYKSLTSEDIMRVYNKYIKGRNCIITSFVPQGHPELIVEGSLRANVTIEDVSTQDFEADGSVIVDEEYERTPSKIDRDIEPELNGELIFNAPEIWTSKLANGVGVYGIEKSELPLVYFNIAIDGGQIMDKEGKSGLANLTAMLMNEGSMFRTPEDMEEDVNLLGAQLSVSARPEQIVLQGYCMSDYFDELMGIAAEKLFSPRWDESEFERIKQTVLAQIQQNNTNPSALGTYAMYKLLFGGSSLGYPLMGTTESVSSITIDDLKQYYADNFAPNISRIHVVGDMTEKDVCKVLEDKFGSWSHEDVNLPVPSFSPVKSDSRIFMIDVPGATQSAVYVFKPSVSRASGQFAPITAANFSLGESSSSRLFSILRLQMGYTYGAYSQLVARQYQNFFVASSNVQGSVTKESVDLFKQIISTYGETFSEAELKATKDALLRNQAGSYETYQAVLTLLTNIGNYGLPADYATKYSEYYSNLTLDQIKATVASELAEQEMYYVVVGDASLHYSKLAQCGLGQPVMLEK